MSRKPMSCYIQLQPRVKERPRLGRRGKVFTPERTTLAEEAIVKHWRRKVRRKPFDGPVRLEIHFDKHGQKITVTPIDNKNLLRGDLDNYVKLVSDALNGVAYIDDKQVAEIRATSTGEDFNAHQ